MLGFVLGARVGVGATADVYDIGDGKVIKLYHKGYPREAAALEYGNAQKLNDTPLPVAKSYGLTELDGRYGIIYDKLTGPSLLDIAYGRLSCAPPDLAGLTAEMERYAAVMADVQKGMLSLTLSGLRGVKDILRANIASAPCLSAREKAYYADRLAELPDGGALGHGDMHLGNIIETSNGCFIIDYMNLCHGHRLFDIARTYYLTALTPVPASMPGREAVVRIKQNTADAYLCAMGVTRAEIGDYLRVTLAARFAETADGALERESLAELLRTPFDP